MNEYKLTVAGILAILSIGFIFLIFFGVSAVSYFGVVVIVSTVLGSVGYTWWKTQTDKTIERLKNELLLKIKKDYLDTEKLFNQVAELVDIESIIRDLSSLRDNLIKLGFYDSNFEIKNSAVGEYTLTSIEQENRRVEQRIRSLEALATVSLKPELETYIELLNQKLVELKNVGYMIEEDEAEFAAIASHEAVSLREMLDKRRRMREKFVSILQKCVDESRTILATSQKYGMVKTVEQELNKIKLDDFDSSVGGLVAARNKLKEFLKEFFEIEYTQLKTAVEKVSPFLEDENLDETQREELQSLINNILSINDPGAIAHLDELKKHFKEKLAALVNALYNRLSEIEKDIEAESPPREVWTKDELIESVVNRLSADTELDVFSRHAADALKHITEQLNKDNAFVKILGNYERLEPLITKKLAEDGRLKASNLNVKYPEHFLMLYNKKHPNTEYRKSTSTLVKI